MSHDFKPSYDWKLLKRREKSVEGLRIFYEQCIHERSKSGTAENLMKSKGPR